MTAVTSAAAGTVGGTVGGGAMGRVDELLGRPVSMRSLALLRILIGPVVVLHLWPFVSDALDGRIYRDTFYEPYAGWYPELPRSLYSGLLYLGVVAAVALSLGLATRVSSAVVVGVVAYNLFLSTTHVHNNRAFLVIVLAGLAVAPCGRELSVDAWWRRRRGLPPLRTSAPAWPLWLLRFEASVLYGASGLSKLLDPDWFGGTVNWHRTVQHRADLVASPLPDWVVDLLFERSFHTFTAKAIVLTELAIAAGLWSRRTRCAAVWLAVCFHVAIQLTASVEVFSYLAIAALAIWAVPSTRDRVLALPATTRARPAVAAALRRLDWLARFQLLPAAPSAVALSPGHPGTVPSPNGDRAAAPSTGEGRHRAIAEATGDGSSAEAGMPGEGASTAVPAATDATVDGSSVAEPPVSAEAGRRDDASSASQAASAVPTHAESTGDAAGVGETGGPGEGSPAGRDAATGEVVVSQVPGGGGTAGEAAVSGEADVAGEGSSSGGRASTADAGAAGGVAQVDARGVGAVAGGGDVVTVVDRDGRVRTGRAAVVFVLSRLPLTAWFALPVRLLPSMRRAGEERA